MAITLRNTKGSPLTYSEVDGNFTHLTNKILTSSDYPLESTTASVAVSNLTGGFWSNVSPAPEIRRIPGRLFIGDAVSSSGESSQTASESWLYESFGAYWLERGSQVFVLPEEPGYIAVTGAARTSTADPTGNVAIGVAGVAWNNHVGTRLAWAGYFEAVREASAGPTYGLEIACKNKGGNVIRNPYARTSDGTLGLFFAGGGDSSYGGSPANPSNAALVVGKNSTTWNVGLCFDADAITGTDGVTGTGQAIMLAKGHRIDWFCDSSNIGAQIYSDVSTGAGKKKRVIFGDSNLFIGNDANGSLFNFAFNGSEVNGIQFSATDAGAGNVNINATGTDTNIDIQLLPKGAGVLRFGTHSALAGETVSGYITIKDSAGNSRKIAVVS